MPGRDAAGHQAPLNAGLVHLARQLGYWLLGGFIVDKFHRDVESLDPYITDDLVFGCQLSQSLDSEALQVHNVVEDAVALYHFNASERPGTSRRMPGKGATQVQF